LLSASLALFGGFQAWMCSPNPTDDGGRRLSFELVAYNAMEVLLLVLSVNQKSLMGQVLVQLLTLFVINSTTRADGKSLKYAISVIVAIFGVLVLTLDRYTIVHFPKIETIIWSIVTIDLHSFISENNHGISPRTIFQSEALGAVISFMISSLIWVNNAERIELLSIDYDMYSKLAIIVMTAGLAHLLFKRLTVTWPRRLQIPIQPSTTFIFISIATAIVYSLIHTEEVSWALIASIGMLATGDYLASTSVRSDVRPSVLRAQRYEEQSLSFIRVVVLIGITFLILSTYSSATINAAIRAKLSIRTDEEYLMIDDDFDEKTYLPTNINNITYDTSPKEIERQELREQCFIKTRKLIMDTIFPLIPRNKNFTAVDFPLSWDLGYQQIWMGQERLWHIYGQFPLRMTAMGQRDIPSVQDNLKDGAIFLPGGSNFGDLNQDAMNYKLSVLKSYPENPIVSLPQTMYYASTDHTEKHKTEINAHTKLTLLWRDQESLQLAKEYYPSAQSLYCPDMAYMLGPALPNSLPQIDVIFIVRLDAEKTTDGADIANAKKAVEDAGYTVEVWDFPTKGYPMYQDSVTKEVVYDYRKILPGRLEPKSEPNNELYSELRVQIGINLLSRGKIIITDRLHALIMAQMIDRTVFYFDNKFKKLTQVRTAHVNAVSECQDKVFNAKKVESISDATKQSIEYLTKRTKKVPPK
jgi:pyruvyl transferase EpsO